METGPVGRASPSSGSTTMRGSSGASTVEMPRVAVRPASTAAPSQDRPSSPSGAVDPRIAIEAATWETIGRGSRDAARLLAERAALRIRAYARRREGTRTDRAAGPGELV